MATGNGVATNNKTK